MEKIQAVYQISLRHWHEPTEDMAAKIRNIVPVISTDHYERPMLLLNGRMWADPVEEKPELDTIEVWNLVNSGFLSHPIHISFFQFSFFFQRMRLSQAQRL